MPSPKPPRNGFYASLYTARERDALSGPVSLDDEQQLLRAHVVRLARLLTRQKDLKDQLGCMRALLLTVHAIAALERVKLMARSREGDIGREIQEALADLDPYEEL